MTPKPPDPLYDLVHILWRMLRSLVAELDRWARRHYAHGFKQGESDRD